MPYAPTTWVNNTTPVDAARMNNIEGGIVAAEVTANKNQPSGYVGLNASGNAFFGTTTGPGVNYGVGIWGAGDIHVVRNTALECLNLSLTGDTQPRFQALADGKITWGPGNAAGDTYLYRTAPATLKTDGFFYAEVASAAAALGARRTGDTGWRWYVSSDGAFNWGPAGGTYDANLYRAGTGVLRSNSQFWTDGAIFASYVGNYVSVGAVGPTGQSGLTFYGDTNLYRYAAGGLATDALFRPAHVTCLGDLYWGGRLMSASVQNITVTGGYAPWRIPMYDGGGTLLGYIPLLTA